MEVVGSSELKKIWGYMDTSVDSVRADMSADVTTGSFLKCYENAHI